MSSSRAWSASAPTYSPTRCITVDRLTQAANSIDEVHLAALGHSQLPLTLSALRRAALQLIQIMYSSLSYLTRKANFKPVNPNIPVTQAIPNAEDPQTFAGAPEAHSHLCTYMIQGPHTPFACAANQQELVSDFLRKAKQLEYLIQSLPSSSSSSADPSAVSAAEEAELEELEKEMQGVNTEYEEALGVAGTLFRRWRWRALPSSAS